jgi:hypothetical protein
VVEGGGLENRCPERDRGFESYSLRQRSNEAIFADSEYWFRVYGFYGEMAESAEGARLLSECRVKNSTEGSNPSLSAIII